MNINIINIYKYINICIIKQLSIWFCVKGCILYVTYSVKVLHIHQGRQDTVKT